MSKISVGICVWSGPLFFVCVCCYSLFSSVLLYTTVYYVSGGRILFEGWWWVYMGYANVEGVGHCRYCLLCQIPASFPLQLLRLCFIPSFDNTSCILSPLFHFSLMPLFLFFFSSFFVRVIFLSSFLFIHIYIYTVVFLVLLLSPSPLLFVFLSLPHRLSLHLSLVYFLVLFPVFLMFVSNVLSVSVILLCLS